MVAWTERDEWNVLTVENKEGAVMLTITDNEGSYFLDHKKWWRSPPVTLRYCTCVIYIAHSVIL
jgi:hypothetical protein